MDEYKWNLLLATAGYKDPAALAKAARFHPRVLTSMKKGGFPQGRTVNKMLKALNAGRAAHGVKTPVAYEDIAECFPEWEATEVKTGA